MIPGGPRPNMQALLQQAQKMQQDLAAAQQELAETEVEGSAGGGLVEGDGVPARVSCAAW